MILQIKNVTTKQANSLVTHLNLEEIQKGLQDQWTHITLSHIQEMESVNLINICIQYSVLFLKRKHGYLFNVFQVDSNTSVPLNKKVLVMNFYEWKILVTI